MIMQALLKCFSNLGLNSEEGPIFCEVLTEFGLGQYFKVYLKFLAKVKHQRNSKHIKKEH